MKLHSSSFVLHWADSQKLLNQIADVESESLRDGTIKYSYMKDWLKQEVPYHVVLWRCPSSMSMQNVESQIKAEKLLQPFLKTVCEVIIKKHSLYVFLNVW